jgi:23S rRNA pseudouridine1911/1915/1917 synthase
MALFEKERDLNRPPEDLILEVDGSYFQAKANELSLRLDQFLAAHLTWRSRSSIRDLVKDGFIELDASTPDQPNGSGTFRPEKRPGKKLQHGSRVRVIIPPHLRLPVPEGVSPIDVLHEDDDVTAVEKPAMVPVHPSGRHVNDTLIQRLHGHYADQLIDEGLAPRLAHRLDRETSGIVLVGRRPGSHTELRRQFEAGEIDKRYLAIVEGVVEAEKGSLTWPIGPSHTSIIRLKMTVSEDGLEARTDWSVIERFNDVTLIACELFTGRQHQIRLHLAAMGHPIVGDKLYGPDEEIFARASDGELTDEDRELLRIDRQALHHHRVAFDQPTTGERIVVESPLAADLQAFLDARR